MSKRERQSKDHRAEGEDLFQRIQVETVRGLLCQALPLARSLVRETDLTPNDVLLLVEKLYALLGQTADEIIDKPQVLRGLPIEFKTEKSKADLLASLQWEYELLSDTGDLALHGGDCYEA